MQAFLFLLAAYLLAVLVILPIWAFVKFRGQATENRNLRVGIDRLQREINVLRTELNSASVKTEVTPPTPAPMVEFAPVPPAPPPLAARATAAPALSVIPELPPPVVPVAPPPVQAMPELPPELPRPAVVYTPPAAPRKPAVNWEQFMGAKLFAWLGGLALFLGVAFFVKYSFEHDLIPPEVRVALGFLVGIGLVVGGLKIPRARYAITAQTLVGAGVVSLYAVTFACNSIYHFPFFGPLPTFLLMTLVTGTAFVLAVRLNAQVVALLGILGGFLTPILLSTGVDNPGGLFGYLALLVVGLAAVALHRRWDYLVPLGAAGVVLMLLGWTDKFYDPSKALIAIAICFGFSALYQIIYQFARWRKQDSPLVLSAAVGLPAVALGYALFFISDGVLATQPGLLLSFILVSDLLLLALVWIDGRLDKLAGLIGLAVFGLLAIWTTTTLTNELLPWALGAFLGFAALHAAFPLLLERRRPESAAGWSGQLFPPFSLLLMLIPLFKLETASFLLWPAILLVDVLAIVLAAITASLATVAVVLVLTLVATALCIFKVPSALPVPFSVLFIIGGFAVFFIAASAWLARRLGGRIPGDAGSKFSNAIFGPTRAQLPAFSSLLPFLLLIMACARLNLPDPSAVFGLGLLLVLLTLGLARLMVIAWLPLCALLGITAVELAWHARHFTHGSASTPLAWYLGFYALFAVFPFLFRKHFSAITGPWAVAALSGPAHFVMIYAALRTLWPADLLGAIPAMFAVVPLLSLFVVIQSIPATEPKRLNQLAWFGGIALLFITLIFPIQFERQWLTVAWALEGVALLWLFHRVPHPGLRTTGAVLLVTAFARLALNPAVGSYRIRGDTGLLNWYLYAYGLAIVALFIGARLVVIRARSDGEADDPTVMGLNAPALFNTFGVILAFLLLNIEIADFYTQPGSRSLALQFSGSFARDMTYTIAWALFALGLLVTGIWKGARAARYAAIALLSVALLKLFFHDLARLEALYRVAALFAVAVIAILASFAYQRFLPSHEKNPAPPV